MWTVAADGAHAARRRRLVWPVMSLEIAGADLVLPDRIVPAGALRIDGDQIMAVDPDRPHRGGVATHLDARGLIVVPGFIDVHVHGVNGCDMLDGDGAVARVAADLPRFGVTAFCPTTVACAPEALRGVLEQVRACRATRQEGHARVLPAHLESNFINPAMRGAQALEQLRQPLASGTATDAFTGAEILDVIAAFRAEVGIVTLAPELPGAIDLIRALAAAGHRISLGHSTASFEMANRAFDAGARQATHLFNRMPPLGHRDPGLVGAVLSRQDVMAELICDGYHVHPAVARMTMALKGPEKVLAVTDGTSGSGLPVGARARLGGRRIEVREQAAFLDDGTAAGSIQTMDAVFRTAVTLSGDSLVAAAMMCATAPARALGLDNHGIIAPGAIADLVVLDRDLRVRYTCVAGRMVYSARPKGQPH